MRINNQASPTGWTWANLDPKMSDKIAMSLMRMLRAGPEVSLSGSPTVSPTTAALWISLPFLTVLPC